MKIAHLATIDVGVRFLLLNQLQRIQAAGHEVHAICRDGPWLSEVRAAGITVHTLPFSRQIAPRDDLSALWQLVRLLRRERYDLIHTHTPKASLLGQWAAWLARVPRRVHTIHGLYFPGSMQPRARRFYTWLERITMRPAHLVLSQSREDVRTAVESHICRADRLLYLGNGIDVRHFDPASVRAVDLAELRAELHIASDQQVIGIVGRQVAEKGFFEFFSAAKQISQRWPKTTFLCVGPEEPGKPDALTAADRQQAQAMADIRFLGMRRDLPQLYALMDILVHPSHREGFPRVPMEAAAMARPLVLTDIRGCREVVAHEQNGLLVPLRDPAALAQAIERLLDNPQLAVQLGAAARQRALSEFDEQIIFQRVLAAYQQLDPLST